MVTLLRLFTENLPRILSMAEAVVPFVAGWDFVRTLGEGAYGELVSVI